MTPENVQRSLALLEAKLSLMRGRELTTGQVELFSAVLTPMQDREGQRAVLELVTESVYVPEPADLSRRYAALLGSAPGETTAETMARHERCRRAAERLEAERQERTARLRKRFEGWTIPQLQRYCLDRGFAIGDVSEMLGRRIETSTQSALPSPEAAVPAVRETEWQRRLRQSGSNRFQVIEQMIRSAEGSQ